MTETSKTINIPGITRPTSYDNLADYQREGHLVAQITAEYAVRFPSLGQHLLAALAEAKHLGLEVEDGTIRIARTTDELDASLASEQRSWDHIRDYYLKAVDDPASITEPYRRGWVDTFATNEGLPAIEWPEVSA
jgi:hypothetical protein